MDLWILSACITCMRVFHACKPQNPARARDLLCSPSLYALIRARGARECSPNQHLKKATLGPTSEKGNAWGKSQHLAVATKTQRQPMMTSTCPSYVCVCERERERERERQQTMMSTRPYCFVFAVFISQLIYILYIYIYIYTYIYRT